MSLIICSKCGKEFSDKVKDCPNCGETNKKSQREMTVSFSPKRILVLSCIMFALAIFFFIYGTTRFTWREFGIHKDQYEWYKESYLENMYDNPEDAKWDKEQMKFRKSEMYKTGTIGAVSFVSGGVLVFIGVSLLREDKNAKLEEGT